MSKVNFITNIHLKDVLGKELINDDNVAISELVKNGYDSNSEKVIVSFLDIFDSINSSITIQDYGEGMDEDDIRFKWLNIAYSSKKDSSNHGKPYAGAKGIGRFSCDRLGETLTLVTRKKKGEILKLVIDWSKFEDEDHGETQIEKIKLDLTTIDLSEARKLLNDSTFLSGTGLVIKKLRKGWSREDILKLKKSLSKIINPNVEYTKDKFSIFLEVPDLIEEDKKLDSSKKVNGEIKNEIFKNLSFRTTYIKATIDEDGEFITTEIFDNAERVIKVIEKNNFKLLKSVEVLVHFLNPFSKIYFKKQTGYRNIEFGSVFLFVNGFRVSPYGEPENDWLLLNRRKIQGHSRYLGARDVVGKIDIYDSGRVFRQVSSREGLVINEHYRQLFISDETDSFFYKTFRRLERFVINGLNWDVIKAPAGMATNAYISELEEKLLSGKIESLDKYEKWEATSRERNLSIATSLSNILALKKDEVVDLYINPDLLTDIYIEEVEEQNKIIDGLDSFKGFISADKVKKAVEKLKDQNEKIKQNLDKELAKKKKSEGHIKTLKEKVEDTERQLFFHKKALTQDHKDLIYLHHEIGVLSETISTNLSLLLGKVDNNKATPEEIKKYIQRIAKANETIQAVSRFATVGDLKNQSLEKVRDLQVYISEYINTLNENRIYSSLAGGALDYNIIKISGSWKMKFKQIDVCMIVDNLLSNAKKAGASKINIEFKDGGKFLEVLFSNNGKVINSHVEEHLFLPGFTTTSGSGMGLAHIKDILKNYSSDISLFSTDPVTFRLRFLCENKN